MQELRSNAMTVAGPPKQRTEVDTHALNFDALTKMGQGSCTLPLIRIGHYQFASGHASEGSNIGTTVVAATSIEVHQSGVADLQRILHKATPVLLSAVRDTNVNHSLHHRWASKDLEKAQPKIQ